MNSDSSSVTLKKIGDMETVLEGVMVRARAELGVTSFGMQVINFPAHCDAYPTHDHVEDGQEEVYIPLQGSGTLRAGERDYPLEVGAMARVGPSEPRKVITGEEPLQLLVIGGTPGKPYEVSPGTSLGSTPPSVVPDEA
jgi:mannose-6-phosphate isomerase-like protein (cupin superfamily)